MSYKYCSFPNLWEFLRYLFLISSLISLWSWNIFCMITGLLNVLRLVFMAQIFFFFFANVQLKRMYILLLLGGMFFYKCKIFFDGVQILCILANILCLFLPLLFIESRVLKCQTIILDLLFFLPLI